jgi:hypothetical protein
VRNKFLTTLALLLASLAGFVYAAEADFDFEKLMEGVELNANELQNSIVFEDVEAGINYTHELQTSFAKVEGFFAEWGYAQDAVGYSQEYQALAKQIEESLQKKDFTTAYDQSLELTKGCKACHDRYKPLPL